VTETTDITERLRDCWPAWKIAGEAADEIIRLRAENADLRVSVVAFGAPWAVQDAQDWGAPPKHIHHTHYDILARAGARMDDFTRWEPNP
jgi:hypothetical protein